VFTIELGWMPVPYSSGDGAKFLVGIQYHDDALASYLAANRIPFAKLDGAAFYTRVWGPHWTPEGQQFVAERILGLLSANNIGQHNATAQKLRLARFAHVLRRRKGDQRATLGPSSAW
jgi:hypothetical protein